MAEKTQQDRDHEWSIELFKSVLETGKTALNTLLIVCGGSALALLAFIGNLAKDGNSPRIPGLAPALLCYALSLGVIAFEAGATYLAQFFYAGDAYRTGVVNTWQKRAGHTFNVIAATAFVVALGFYAFGSWTAYCELSLTSATGMPMKAQ